MKHSAEKYFSQKRWTVLEIICLLTAIGGVIAFMFIWGGGPIGLPVFLVSLVVLIVSKSQKVKDAEVDHAVKKMLTPYLEKLDSEQVIQTFDLQVTPLIKGTDGRLRTAVYVASLFDVQEAITKIHTFRCNLLTGEVCEQAYSIPQDVIIELKEISLPLAGKTAHVLECEAHALCIPVTVNDVYSAELIEKITKTKQ